MGLIDRIKDRIEAIPEVVWSPRPEVLLCANTVKPMHGVVPRVILGKPWWDETRKKAYASTNYHCIACRVHKSQAAEHKWLEGHELYSINYKKGIQTYIETVPLCHYCHNFIHDGRLITLLESGEVSEAKYNAIIDHGLEVLKAAGLKKKLYTGPIAEWGKWRLVLEDKEYPPLYKDYEEWLTHFQGTDE